MQETEIAFLFAVFIGAFIRTMAPFIRKWSAGECEEFDHMYTVTFLISFIVAAMVSMIQFTATTVPQGDPVMVFAIGLGLGWGSNGIINELVKVFLG